MIYYNISFHVDERQERVFLAWVRDTVIPAGEKCGLNAPKLCKIIDSVSPGCASFALQFQADDIATVHKFDAGTRQEVMQWMTAIWGDAAIAFTSSMQEVQLWD